MMDKRDPEYQAIVEFLESERRLYLENVVKKEEERGKFDKSKKTLKTLGKVGTL